MSSAVYSLTLTDYFEESYLPQLLENAPLDQVKQYRNAIGQADLLLGYVATIGDLVDPSLSQWYVDHLQEKGFTRQRAEAFASCLRELQEGARQDRRVRRKPKSQEPNRQRVDAIDPVVMAALGRSRSISRALLSMLEPDDFVCTGEL